MRAPSNDVADGTVLQEFRRGFKIGGQLLRPAMVQVRNPEAVPRKECSGHANVQHCHGIMRSRCD
jgi:GrpE